MDDYTKYLKVHPSGKLVTRGVLYKSPVVPQLMNGYTTDQALRIQDARMLNSREFLFMPVHISPVLVYLASEKQWHYRFTTSFSVFSRLWTIGRTYSNPEDPYYQMNKEAIDKARDDMMLEMTQFDDTFLKDVQSFPTDMCEADFVKYMQISTINRIRILEKCIQRCFQLPFQLPPTPYEFPSINQLSKEDETNYVKYLKHYFDCKAAIRRDRLKLESGIDENREYFPSLIATEGGVNFSKLLREYFLFLKE